MIDKHFKISRHMVENFYTLLLQILKNSVIFKGRSMTNLQIKWDQILFQRGRRQAKLRYVTLVVTTSLSIVCSVHAQRTYTLQNWCSVCRHFPKSYFPIIYEHSTCVLLKQTFALICGHKVGTGSEARVRTLHDSAEEGYIANDMSSHTQERGRYRFVLHFQHHTP